jgi:pimeloyl-ACP methyl ester carboxylesterase
MTAQKQRSLFLALVFKPDNQDREFSMRNGMLYWQQQGNGPEVVLLHGFLGCGKIFEPLTDDLLHQFSVTTIDLPGFGKSYDVTVPRRT